MGDVGQNIAELDQLPARVSPGTLEAWFRADSGITLVSGAVSSWKSRVHEHTITQGTASARPGFSATTGGLNNRPAITLDAASSQYLSGAASLASILESSDSTIFSVFRRVATGTFHTVWSVGDSANSTDYIWFACNATNKLFYRRFASGSGNDDAGNTNVLTTAVQANVHHDGSNSQLRLRTTDRRPP